MKLRPTILVVDNDTRMQKLISEILEMTGYTVLASVNNGDALSLVGIERPNLILLESMTHPVDGYTLCRKIREFSQTPVIMITEGDSDEEGLKALEAGADDYLTKPFSHIELATRIKKVLGPGAQISGKSARVLYCDRLTQRRLIDYTYGFYEAGHREDLSHTCPANTGIPDYNRN